MCIKRVVETMQIKSRHFLDNFKRRSILKTKHGGGPTCYSLLFSLSLLFSFSFFPFLISFLPTSSSYHPSYSTMFWRFGFHNPSAVDTLLDREDVTLEEVLEEEELLQEAKSHNQRLVDLYPF
jgi:hypothetical protein